MASTWLVRADSGGRLAPEFKSKSLVAIGWIEARNTLDLTTREAFFLRMKEAYPEDSKPKQHNAAGQVFRFVREIQVGDQVVTYDNARRTYLVGRIAGVPKYDTELFDGEFPTFRQVEWLSEVSRDALTLKAKNSLGSTMTLFKVPAETVVEIEALMGGAQPQQASEEEEALEEKDLLQDLQSKSLEFIKDRVSKLDWEQMQELTAGLLRAMGYKTRISPTGPDRGKDIVASPDGFGFEQPRIIVEVKHRRGQMGTQEVRGFLAVIRHAGDKGLYVSMDCCPRCFELNCQALDIGNGRTAEGQNHKARQLPGLAHQTLLSPIEAGQIKHLRLIRFKTCTVMFWKGISVLGEAQISQASPKST